MEYLACNSCEAISLAFYNVLYSVSYDKSNDSKITGKGSYFGVLSSQKSRKELSRMRYTHVVATVYAASNSSHKCARGEQAFFNLTLRI